MDKTNDKLVTRVIIIHELMPEDVYLGSEVAEENRTQNHVNNLYRTIRDDRTENVKIYHTTTVVSEQ